MKLTYTPPPTVAAFMRDRAKMRLIMGPRGSGKSSGSIMEILRCASEQAPDIDGWRRTRTLVVRNTYRALQDTTWRTFMAWLGPLGKWKESEKTFFMQIGDIKCEVMFRALDTPADVQKLLSLEATNAYVNEAREIDPEIIENLSMSLGRYPEPKSRPPHIPQAQWPTWKGMWLDTNPPVIDSWLWKQMEKIEGENGWGVYKQPSGRSPFAENLENLPSGYYDTTGKSEETIRTLIDGEYGHSSAGTPVFGKSFRRDFHVIRDPAVPEHPGMAGMTPHERTFADAVLGISSNPIVVGMDLGLTPAAVIGQQQATGQVVVFEELAAFNMGAIRFARTMLKPALNARYPGRQILLVVDPAGMQRAQTDESTVVEVLRREGFAVIPASTNALAGRLAAVETLLMRQIDGKAGFLVSSKCPRLISALGGEYRYKSKNNGETEPTPEKNHASHISDALQYFCLHVEGSIGVRPKSKVRQITSVPYPWC